MLRKVKLWNLLGHQSFWQKKIKSYTLVFIKNSITLLTLLELGMASGRPNGPYFALFLNNIFAFNTAFFLFFCFSSASFWNSIWKSVSSILVKIYFFQITWAIQPSMQIGYIFSDVNFTWIFYHHYSVFIAYEEKKGKIVENILRKNYCQKSLRVEVILSM